MEKNSPFGAKIVKKMYFLVCARNAWRYSTTLFDVLAKHYYYYYYFFFLLPAFFFFTFSTQRGKNSFFFPLFKASKVSHNEVED